MKILIVVILSFLEVSQAFAPPVQPAAAMVVTRTTTIREGRSSSSSTVLFSGENNNNNNDNLLDRFTSPKLDDPWLPFTEAGLAQIVAPSLQLFFLASANSPFPSWAAPFFTDFNFAPRGSFLAPTLVHGAGLACCWLMGSLASKSYEKESFEGDLTTVFWTTAKAGAGATGLLILATQFDLYTEMGGYVQFGDSVETDLRLYKASVELINDIFFEGLTLLPWRLFRATVV